MNMVQFDEARKLMDEMMKVAIFQPSEKRRMLTDERKLFLNPNLIMDARHKIYCENPRTLVKASVLTEAQRTQEETRELQMKKEQAFIERELRKFEQDLQKSRPKFFRKSCSKRNLASSDDENFWGTTSRLKRIALNKKKYKTTEQKVSITQKKIKEAFANFSPESEDVTQSPINEVEGASFGSIKVTIKDKPSCESQESRLRILRSCFEAFRKNAQDKRRFREIKANIQNVASRRKLKSCVRVWRTHVEKAKAERERVTQNSNMRKIETLIDVITETQKELKSRKPKEFSASTRNAEEKMRIPSKPCVAESPAQNRLNVQKEIIRKQKLKLAEQDKIIEELTLKQVQEEIMKASEETVNMAKETLTHCGQQTRRTLIQLMRQAGYRDKSLTAPVRVPSPPRFLARMEARAEARRSRVKLREEARQKKLEDERRKEETARREAEQERRRSQQEALREAKRLREEREQQRAREIERFKNLNAMAEEFYRKYLLRRYIMDPFAALVETKNNYINKAEDHYKRSLLRKAFASWRTETERQSQIRTELAVSLHNRNLLWRALQTWRDGVREEKRKTQVAKDFADMRLQNKYFKLWKVKTVDYKAERLQRERSALQHYEEKLKIRYFNMWKKYPKIMPDIKESEQMRNAWRQIVREVIPDFDPRQRGVILED